jgi:membrane-associated phospholipid phosphatase
MKNLLSHYVRKTKRWALSQPTAKHMQERHPGIVSFIANRFHPKAFIGLPLTLTILAIGLNIVLLSELTESVIEAEWIVRADKKFAATLYSFRLPGLSQALFLLTWLGDQEAVFIIGAFVSAIFLFRKRYVAFIAYWLTMTGVGLSVRYGKNIISRARPTNWSYYEVEHFSFPSGHATTALALYGLLAYFLYRHYLKRTPRLIIIWFTIALTITIGFSRIYLGVHFLSDVLAGYLLGLIWLLLGVSLLEVMIYRNNKAQTKKKR